MGAAVGAGAQLVPFQTPILANLSLTGPVSPPCSPTHLQPSLEQNEMKQPDPTRSNQSGPKHGIAVHVEQGCVQGATTDVIHQNLSWSSCQQMSTATWVHRLKGVFQNSYTTHKILHVVSLSYQLITYAILTNSFAHKMTQLCR